MPWLPERPNPTHMRVSPHRHSCRIYEPSSNLPRDVSSRIKLSCIDDVYYSISPLVPNAGKATCSLSSMSDFACCGTVPDQFG